MTRRGVDLTLADLRCMHGVLTIRGTVKAYRGSNIPDIRSEMELIALPGTRTSYSQAGYNLIGRIIENVTSQTFEQAVAQLLFEPLELSHSFFERDAVIRRVLQHGDDG